MPNDLVLSVSGTSAMKITFRTVTGVRKFDGVFKASKASSLENGFA
jgi:hypothetical protein